MSVLRLPTNELCRVELMRHALCLSTSTLLETKHSPFLPDGVTETSMPSLESLNTRTNTASTIQVGIYGFFAYLCQALQLPPREGDNQRQPVDKTLWYRGTQMSSSRISRGSYGRCQSSRLNDSLCYRGLPVTSAVSNKASNCEIQAQPVDNILCYRGVCHSARQSVAA
jgi:hypothetical protein